MRSPAENPTPSPLPEAIVAAASTWLAQRDRGFTPEEQDAYLQWLREDERHGAAVARLEKAWSALDALAEWKPEHSQKPNPDLLAVPRRRFWRWAGAALAVAAVVTFALVLVRPFDTASKTVSVLRSSELRTLADGSVVELNKDAEIAVDYTATERRIKLVRGEAYFTVAKNPDRPFIVTAGGVRVRAVGTVFNVRLDGSAVDVLVTEGKVRIDPPKPEEPELQGALNAAMVGARERTSVNAAVPTPLAPVVIEATSDEIESALSWQGMRLNFKDTPLDEAVKEFNRYNQETRIVVADRRIAKLPLGGKFRADNADAFVRLLELTSGVHAEYEDGRYVLRSAPPR
ncbi:MAG: FecR domain-containing protein [Opitutae bacterium]|nr:FecR domain-containing protein [Opitutae bacterium]